MKQTTYCALMAAFFIVCISIDKTDKLQQLNAIGFIVAFFSAIICSAIESKK